MRMREERSSAVEARWEKWYIRYHGFPMRKIRMHNIGVTRKWVYLCVSLFLAGCRLRLGGWEWENTWRMKVLEGERSVSR